MRWLKCVFFWPYSLSILSLFILRKMNHQKNIMKTKFRNTLIKIFEQKYCGLILYRLLNHQYVPHLSMCGRMLR